MPNKKINALDVKTAVSTDLMLVGDPSTGTAYKSTLATLPLVPTSRTITINGVAFDLSANRAWTIGTVTSVGLTMPSAFGVANSPVTSSGTLAVTALGTASQYIRGDGVLATLPTGGSGGSSVSYYLNGGTAASVGTYFQMSTTAVVGTNADFTRTGNGLISQFLTDVGDPNRLQIPAGNWNFEMFFSMSSSGGNTAFYVELLKYDGTTFTSIASSTLIPEEITGGTNVDLYLTSLAIPATTLLVTDRLALRVYIVNNSGGRTATLHTQDSHLCQIITNFAGGVSALNGLTANTQYFATGTSGTDFGISSVSDTHTFNLPTASATNRGALSSADWTTFNNKVPTSRTLTINGTTYDLSADRSWTISGTNIYNTSGTLTSARTLTLGGFTLDFIGSTHTNRLTSAGRLLLGTTTESTFILDVNGTARVSGQINATSGMQWSNGSGLLQTNAVGGVSILIYQHTIQLDSGNGNNINIDPGTSGSSFAKIFASGVLGLPLCVNGNGRETIFGLDTATASASALVRMESTTKGFLPPRMTTIQRNAIASPATGLIVYQTDGTEGLYERTSSAWRLINASGGGGSMAIGGAITSATAGSVLFAGTSGVLQQNNANFFWDNTNFRLGIGTTTPTKKLEVVGSDAFINTLTIGRGTGNVQSNAVLGYQALNSNTTGFQHVAVGQEALFSNTTTNGSVAIGYQAARSCIGDLNVAIGWRSSFNMTTGFDNTAVGKESMSNVTLTGNSNTAIGGKSLFNTSSGNQNVGIGHSAGSGNTTGSNNIFIGANSAAVAAGDSNRTFIGNGSTTSTWLGGNLLVGSTTDSGQKFQVTGDTKLSGRVKFTPQATPSTPAAGDVYYDSTSNKLRCYNGTIWNDLF